MLHTEWRQRVRAGRCPVGVPRMLWLLGMAVLAQLALLVPAGTALAALPPPTGTASSVEVFVGYADSLRANPNNFPTPWSGSPNVVFAGCQTGCTFDAGAVRLVNNSPLAVTVDSIVVKLSTCAFDMWPHGTVLQPNQQFIVTQTASGAAAGCDSTQGFFDTSDVGPNGGNWSGNCGQSGVVPEVDVSIDGVASAFTDSGKVLNTGGVDVASCPSGTNESTQWTQIGSQPCPGATLTLAPANQTLPIGATATEQATLQNSCGTGLQGAPVTFTVQSGPNAGKTGTGTTDANGVASFAYTSTATGTDSLQASTANPAGTITSNAATVAWQKKPSQLSVASSGTTGDFNDATTVSATLVDNQGPVAGAPVTFTLNGAQTCTGTTNPSGVASCALTPQEAAGSYPLVVTFAGDATHVPASVTAPFTVTHEESVAAYTGPTVAANGQPITLSGTLSEDGQSPISGRTLAFTLGSGATAQSCSATTNASGQAACTIAAVNQPTSATSVPVSVVFAGDGFYKPASASATVRQQYMTGEAYGLRSTGLVVISPTPDTGPVATAAATTVAPPCVAGISGLIVAHTLCAGVTTTVGPGGSTATASVQDATIGVLGLPVIQIKAVRSTSHTTCSGASGQTTITSITVGGVAVNVSASPAPNTKVSVLGVQLVINEQLPVPGADHGLTVNGVHISAAGLLDVVVASATSDIHNC